MQQLLKEAPYLTLDASQAGRLFLSKGVGALSAGTPVTTLAAADSLDSVIAVKGWIQVPTETLGKWGKKLKRVEIEQQVTLDCLVIRKRKQHPNATAENHADRRKKILVGREILTGSVRRQHAT